jgi:hypothetical protein
MNLSFQRSVTICCCNTPATTPGLAVHVAQAASSTANSSGDNSEQSEGFAALMGRFGQVTNGLSLLLSLLGTSLIVRRAGVF